MTHPLATRGSGAGPLDAAMLRIFDEGDCPVGVGFLVASDIALTCAHVVYAALDIKDGAKPAPGATVRVDLPLLGAGHGGTGTTASIEHWIPARDSGGGDVAVLRLAAPVPGAWPVRLVCQYEDLWGDSVRAFGVPAGHPGGVWRLFELDRACVGWGLIGLVAAA